MTLETITLHDDTTGARARILPGFGFNCYSFEVPSADGPVELLWSAADFTSGEARPSGSGIPLLFPFPGRIRGGRFRFGGREFSLPPSDGLGNAIHGFVLDRPWRVVEQTTTQVTGEFHAAVVDPEILKMWPADFLLRITYTLSGQSLSARVVVDNPSKDPLPFGFGAHPYFRLPLGAGGSAADCRVGVPVGRQWELTNLLPTGRQLSLAEDHPLRTGAPLGERTYDAVFSDLEFSQGTCQSRIEDPRSGRTLRIQFDDQFRHAVVYTPPHREAVCIEPYTCVPDPFWLAEQGVDAGLRVLQPGESFSASFEVNFR